MEGLKLVLGYVVAYVVLAALAWLFRFFLTLAGMIVLFLLAFVYFTFTLELPNVDGIFTPFQCWIVYLMVSAAICLKMLLDEIEELSEYEKNHKPRYEKCGSIKVQRIPYSEADVSCSDRDEFYNFITNFDVKLKEEVRCGAISDKDRIKKIKNGITSWGLKKNYSEYGIKRIFITLGLK